MSTVEPLAHVGTADGVLSPLPSLASLPSLSLYRQLVHQLAASAAQGGLSPLYIDLGAEHPTADSLTQMLHERGWRGVNVEPVPAYLHYLKNQRPADRNLPSMPLLDAWQAAHGGLLRLHLGRAVTADDAAVLAGAAASHRPAVICVEDAPSADTLLAPWATALTQAGFVQVVPHSVPSGVVTVWVDPARPALHKALVAVFAAALTTDGAPAPAIDGTVRTAPLPASLHPASLLPQAASAPASADDARQLLRRRVLAMVQEGRVLAVLKSRARRLAVAAVRRGLLTNSVGLALMAQLERIPRLRSLVQRLTRSQQGLTPVSVALLQQMKAAIAAAPSSKPSGQRTFSEPSPPTMPSAANASAASRTSKP